MNHPISNIDIEKNLQTYLIKENIFTDYVFDNKDKEIISSQKLYDIARAFSSKLRNFINSIINDNTQNVKNEEQLAEIINNKDNVRFSLNTFINDTLFISKLLQYLNLFSQSIKFNKHNANSNDIINTINQIILDFKTVLFNLSPTFKNYDIYNLNKDILLEEILKNNIEPRQINILIETYNKFWMYFINILNPTNKIFEITQNALNLLDKLETSAIDIDEWLNTSSYKADLTSSNLTDSVMIIKEYQTKLKSEMILLQYIDFLENKIPKYEQQISQDLQTIEFLRDEMRKTQEICQNLSSERTLRQNEMKELENKLSEIPEKVLQSLDVDDTTMAKARNYVKNYISNDLKDVPHDKILQELNKFINILKNNNLDDIQKYIDSQRNDIQYLIHYALIIYAIKYYELENKNTDIKKYENQIALLEKEKNNVDRILKDRIQTSEIEIKTLTEQLKNNDSNLFNMLKQQMENVLSTIKKMDFKKDIDIISETHDNTTNYDIFIDGVKKIVDILYDFSKIINSGVDFGINFGDIENVRIQINSNLGTIKNKLYMSYKELNEKIEEYSNMFNLMKTKYDQILKDFEEYRKTAETEVTDLRQELQRSREESHDAYIVNEFSKLLIYYYNLKFENFPDIETFTRYMNTFIADLRNFVFTEPDFFMKTKNMYAVFFKNQSEIFNHIIKLSKSMNIELINKLKLRDFEESYIVLKDNYEKNLKLIESLCSENEAQITKKFDTLFQILHDITYISDGVSMLFKDLFDKIKFIDFEKFKSADEKNIDKLMQLNELILIYGDPTQPATSMWFQAQTVIREQLNEQTDKLNAFRENVEKLLQTLLPILQTYNINLNLNDELTSSTIENMIDTLKIKIKSNALKLNTPNYLTQNTGIIDFDTQIPTPLSNTSNESQIFIQQNELPTQLNQSQATEQPSLPTKQNESLANLPTKLNESQTVNQSDLSTQQNALENRQISFSVEQTKLQTEDEQMLIDRLNSKKRKRTNVPDESVISSKINRSEPELPTIETASKSTKEPTTVPETLSEVHTKKTPKQSTGATRLLRSHFKANRDTTNPYKTSKPSQKSTDSSVKILSDVLIKPKSSEKKLEQKTSQKPKKSGVKIISDVIIKPKLSDKTSKQQNPTQVAKSSDSNYTVPSKDVISSVAPNMATDFFDEHQYSPSEIHPLEPIHHQII